MRCLLVPTDGSENARDALRYADALRRQTGAALHLLHVASPTESAPDDTPRQSAEAAGIHTDDLTTTTRTSYAVAPTVLTYADEVDADLIVAGTHGRRGVRRLMLGSVAEELVRTAPVDVLVVPLHPGDEAPARRVLVPTDLHDGTDALLAHARDLAAALGSEHLHLLHVIEPLPYPARMVDEAVLSLVPAVRDRAAADLRQRAEALGIEPDGVYVEVGTPATVIARAATSLNSDLIVVTPHKQGAVKRALLGSVAGEVARDASRPVLVARSLTDDA